MSSPRVSVGDLPLSLFLFNKVLHFLTASETEDPGQRPAGMTVLFYGRFTPDLQKLENFFVLLLK